MSVVDNKIDKKMIIDGMEVEYSDEKNLLEVIRKAGIDVPTFCYKPELSPFGACRMCVVEIEGRGIQTSCTISPEPGMKVSVNTEKTRRIRKMTLELLLASHERECTSCEKSGMCELQDLSQRYGITDVRFESDPGDHPIDSSSPSIVRDKNKCILCGACVRACTELQGKGVLGFAGRGSKTTVGPEFDKEISTTNCIDCGQCVTFCPTGALKIKSEVELLWDAILDKSKFTVAQIAPAVRVAVSEEFGLGKGENVIGLITAALKKIGFDKVFDTNFSADLTIMEEGTEFVTRFKEGGKLPIITSCCPGWVKHAEQNHHDFLENLSTAKSPQQMFGSAAKEVIPKEFGVKKEDIVQISFMPCTAKKFEAKRPEFEKDGVRDVDMVLTSVELIRLIKEAGIDFTKLEPVESDSTMSEGTGAAVIFGTSGGVAEAALRTAYAVITGKELESTDIKEARGFDRIKELSVDVEGTEVKVAIVNTLAAADKLLDRVRKGEASYHMIEVMACPGGCVGGGGQPQKCNDLTFKNARKDGLYKTDANQAKRRSHENAEVNAMYEKYLGAPNKGLAHDILHTKYTKR